MQATGSLLAGPAPEAQETSGSRSLPDPSPPAEAARASVLRVIDGDTIVVDNGVHVRLLGINTPERGQVLFNESTERLRQLIGGEILLEADVEDEDKYGRKLRHVYAGNVPVNLRLVREGYAKVLIIPPNEKHSEVFLEAEARAMDESLGVWKYEGVEDIFCVGIFTLHYNAKGDDNQNLNDEYVTLRNSCSYAVDLSGWVLSDDDNNEYSFGKFTLQNKTTVSIHSGPGEDTAEDLYWNGDKAIWGNGGDRLLLRRNNGDLMLDHPY